VSVRYIGSKNRVVSQILAVLGPPQPGRRFIDAFCGTGAVAAGAARAGWPVHVNDQLLSAVCIAIARVTSREQAPFESFGGHDRAADALNCAEPVPGFTWREYSPASGRVVGFERRYFTEANAAKIDGIRLQIGRWVAEGLVSQFEECILIADLIQATNRVANISGTYGCFLRSWNAQATDQLRVRPRALLDQSAGVTASVGDALDLDTRPTDVYYIDPPYTKRQYAAYYHVLETIAYGDAPVVGGKTGLRPWRDKASDFCYKRRALEAFDRLLSRVAAERVLVSYSSEGHVNLDLLAECLGSHGEVAVHELGAIGRYRPNSQASRTRSHVTEYVLELDTVPSLALAGAGVE
jgi:adenine-specific DNA-methyltransferase